jgi:hypothetical protein
LDDYEGRVGTISQKNDLEGLHLRAIPVPCEPEKQFIFFKPAGPRVGSILHNAILVERTF